jgi:general secretion pathway protein N
MAAAKMTRYCTTFALALGLALMAGHGPVVAAPLSAIAPYADAPASHDTDIDPETKRLDSDNKEQLRGNPLWAIPLSSLTATRERPIFSPSRRPPRPAVLPAVVRAPPPAPPPPAKPERPHFQLVGTVAKDANGIAVIIDQTTKNVIRLKMGEGYNGWILDSIQGRSITLKKGELTETFALPKSTDRESAQSQFGDNPPGMNDPGLLGRPLYIPPN